jgi:hypothetical protein
VSSCAGTHMSHSIACVDCFVFVERSKHVFMHRVCQTSSEIVCTAGSRLLVLVLPPSGCRRAGLLVNPDCGCRMLAGRDCCYQGKT